MQLRFPLLRIAFPYAVVLMSVMLVQDFRERLTRFGEWNDATMDQGYEMFPLCETSIPAPVPGEPMNWGTDVQASFRVRVCIDEMDDIHFQDDRLWIQYGGQYSAAGTHYSCPDRYRGKAYIGNQQWDISGMNACQAGQNCPVSSTFTDPPVSYTHLTLPTKRIV